MAAVFVDAIAATASQAVSIGQQLNALLATDKNRLAELGRLSGSATQLFEALFKNPIANIAVLGNRTGLTPATIGKALDGMVQMGIVRELTGQKRNRVFAYSAYIDILNQDT